MKKAKKKLFQNELALMKSPTHGYGVFAEKTIRKGELIEECYFILSRGGDRVLEDYYFDAKKSKGKRYALFTGYGSIYNHSEDPNADYFLSVSKRITRIVAARTIQKGEEILISYGDEWFKDRGYAPKQAKETVAKKTKVKRKVKKPVAKKKAKRSKKKK